MDINVKISLGGETEISATFTVTRSTGKDMNGFYLGDTLAGVLVWIPDSHWMQIVHAADRAREAVNALR